jgi:hypothetical protein
MVKLTFGEYTQSEKLQVEIAPGVETR